ncbi:hypothetical protein FPQ18DRAFT_338572 [Pyronema domesticum]|uniref:Uncharacterized protein n=1 Tax=Pyronema omphalodes (strain CBS 100304) TaxID=1076935 RepID=U4KYV0_PYROM|nr:hypothetical protein FPQ18DRAFT_338572 [Pyronema domesticum]CCX07166.1 Protein of unknown function [Pyronema omphalodes CBS 100304]
MHFQTALFATLFIFVATVYGQTVDDTGSTTLSTRRSGTPTQTPYASSVTAAAVPSSTRESSEYFPPGVSYDDPMNLGSTQQNNDANGGGAGKSTAFMGGGIGAQIGIIAAVVLLAIGLFVGIVVYYFHRKKQWEKEVKRRSQLPPNAKLIIDKKTGEVRLADRSSSASRVGAEELERGGLKVGKIQGEVKPGFFKMLLGKF